MTIFRQRPPPGALGELEQRHNRLRADFENLLSEFKTEKYHRQEDHVETEGLAALIKDHEDRLLKLRAETTPVRTFADVFSAVSDRIKALEGPPLRKAPVKAKPIAIRRPPEPRKKARKR